MKFIKNLLFKYRLKKAVNTAVNQFDKTGRKHFVIIFNGKPLVITKQRITHMVRTRKFKKGVTVSDIERQALFITSPKKAKKDDIFN